MSRRTALVVATLAAPVGLLLAGQKPTGAVGTAVVLVGLVVAAAARDRAQEVAHVDRPRRDGAAGDSRRSVAVGLVDTDTQGGHGDR